MKGCCSLIILHVKTKTICSFNDLQFNNLTTFITFPSLSVWRKSLERLCRQFTVHGFLKEFNSFSPHFFIEVETCQIAIVTYLPFIRIINMKTTTCVLSIYFFLQCYVNFYHCCLSCLFSPRSKKLLITLLLVWKRMFQCDGH